jgi:hypothetical protein
MRFSKALRGVTVAACVAVGMLLTVASGAMASGATKVCVPEKEGATLKTPKAGVCKPKYKLTELGAEGKEGPQGKEGSKGEKGEPGLSELSKPEQEALKALLPYVKVEASGIDGKPTVLFSGVNVQIVNGEGQTESTNGAGNLVLGYDAHFGPQTGSHNLILGSDQEYTSYSGLLAGRENSITAPFASVSGGVFNKASDSYASVSGGALNTASGEGASVSGGVFNKASDSYASVSGGALNTANFFASSIFGGKELTTESEYEAIP